MKRFLLPAVVVLAFATGAAAQRESGFSRAQALSPAQVYLQQPVWSADGQHIAMAGRGYRGVWLMNADGSGLQQLLKDRGAGYRFRWSRDSRRLVVRSFEYAGRRRVHFIKTVDVPAGETRVLAQFRGSVSGLPVWTGDDSRVLLNTRRGVQTLETQRPATLQQTSDYPVCYNTGNALVFFDALGNEQYRLSPLKGTYLSAELSPDGSKVAFELYGGNLFVVHADGSELRDLGPGERPTWSPDSQWLAFMLTTDDGHTILNSDIFVVNASGGRRQNLTATEDQIEMNPSWSPDGQTIVFDERRSGRIFKMEK
ncbi:MAG: TolB family protein [bacterium]